MGLTVGWFSLMSPTPQNDPEVSRGQAGAATSLHSCFCSPECSFKNSRRPVGSCLLKCFSTGGRFCYSGDMWRCLETFRVLSSLGKGLANGMWWVQASNTATHPAMHSPHERHYPGPNATHAQGQELCSPETQECVLPGPCISC